MSIWGVGLLLIILLRAYQSLSGDNNVNSSRAFLFEGSGSAYVQLKSKFMEDSHFCNESEYCRMKLDMENASNQLIFLKENWADLWSLEKINALSIKDLKCSLCVLNVAINAIATDKFYCPNSETIRLMNTQMYIANKFELHKLQEELRNEQKGV